MIEKILVAVDLEDTALTDRMLAFASDFAKLKSAEVTLVYVATDIAPAAAIQLPADYRDKTSSTISKQLGHLVGELDLPDDAVHVAVQVWLDLPRDIGPGEGGQVRSHYHRLPHAGSGRLFAGSECRARGAPCVVLGVRRPLAPRRH